MNNKIKNLLKRTSRSFYLSIKFIPQNMRDCFACGYLLCRYADTIADTDFFKREHKIILLQKFPELVQKQNEHEIKNLEREIFAIPKKKFKKQSKKQAAEKELLENLFSCLDFLNSLNKDEKNLVYEAVEGVCKGMLLDLNYFDENSQKTKALKTSEQLKEYCYYIGGIPGVFWTKLIMLKYPKNYSRQIMQNAEDVGMGLQLVNILRDIKEDFEIKRCYIPQQDFDKQKFNPEEMTEPQNFYKIKQIADNWIFISATGLYEAKEYFKNLPNNFSLRLSVMLPIFFGMDTLYLLARDFNLNKKIRISKIKVFITIFLSPIYILNDKLFEIFLKLKFRKIKKAV